MVPVVDICFPLLYLLQFLFRIVDQGAKFTLVLFTQGIAEEFVHLTLDIA